MLRSGLAETGLRDAISRPADIETRHGMVRFSLAGDAASIMLPVDTRDGARGFESTPSLAISEITYPVDGRPVCYVTVTCTNKPLETVFAEFVSDILGRIERGEPSRCALTDSLREFRDLLLARDDAVPDEEICGLAGELRLLNHLLDLSPNAWRAWQGPLRGRHDFTAGNHAIEVKATRARNSDRLTISSIDQLDPPAGGDLHLFRVTFEDVAGGPVSIASLAETAFERSDDAPAIRSILDRAGCPDPYVPVWNRLKFRMVSEVLYAVTGDFPRISAPSFVGGKLPHGVEGLSYEIDLAKARDCRLSADALNATLQEVCTCLSPD
ncbi:PD-(D/E)XK motif protein [uncultured Maricaulis sp.]|uniref:PD-(D/E)XK motif protein n=1 Tax=uncultured Maricaulis sp. TaxID=174710 RepID=UPI0026132B1E|nr:PD-(D/E)XK motif protein [uncultured Maricaulis sp.]